MAKSRDTEPKNRPTQLRRGLHFPLIRCHLLYLLIQPSVHLSIWWIISSCGCLWVSTMAESRDAEFKNRPNWAEDFIFNQFVPLTSSADSNAGGSSVCGSLVPWSWILPQRLNHEYNQNRLTQLRAEGLHFPNSMLTSSDPVEFHSLLQYLVEFLSHF